MRVYRAMRSHHTNTRPSAYMIDCSYVCVVFEYEEDGEMVDAADEAEEEDLTPPVEALDKAIEIPIEVRQHTNNRRVRN